MIEVPSFLVVNLNNSRFGMVSSFKYSTSFAACSNALSRLLSREKIIPSRSTIRIGRIESESIVPELKPLEKSSTEPNGGLKFAPMVSWL
jgi:hypothetical protein